MNEPDGQPVFCRYIVEKICCPQSARASQILDNHAGLAGNMIHPVARNRACVNIVPGPGIGRNNDRQCLALEKITLGSTGKANKSEHDGKADRC